jgi:hypothetical protein
MREYPVPVHLWIATLAGHHEYTHARMLGATVMSAIRSSRQVQNDILLIAGGEDKPAVHLPARMIGRP